jgi:hypothetical protein
MMKHVEQLKPNLSNGKRNDTVTVHDNNVKKPIGGRKCCGGDSSDH